MNDLFLDFDSSILLYLQDHVRNSVLTPVMKLITHLGDAGIFWILLTAVLLCFKQTRKAGICSAIALVGSVVLNNMILKPIIDRPRPYTPGCVEGLKLIVKEAHDASFPSGHTAASFASAVALFANLPKKRYSVLLVVLAALIAFSRLYIGIHYPTDVIAGFLDGILLGIMGHFVGKVIYNKFFNKEQKEEA